VPTPDLDTAFQLIAERLVSGARLVGHRPLTGGVSAQIQALEFTLPDGQTREVVFRRHAAAEWKQLADDAIATEYALQNALFQAGLAVPEPLLLDASCTLLPSPYLVMAMVEGTTVVHESQRARSIEQMASFLAGLHELGIETLKLPQLPRREDPVEGALAYIPEIPTWVELRAVIGEWTTAPYRDSLLHGDFWPGNVLWNKNQIAAVIDWEDAAIGPAVSDLAGCRVELMMAYGEPVMEAFTRHYLAISMIDVSDLPLWEVYAASSALATMGDWGLSPKDEAMRRKQTTLFLNRAVHEMMSLTDR
jgi:aminoglycoside phosphotransferase (APT) family kinase protein